MHSLGSITLHSLTKRTISTRSKHTVTTLTNLKRTLTIRNYNEPLLRQRVVSLRQGHWPFPPPPPSVCLRLFFYCACYVCPRRAHCIDTEPCGGVTLSCQLWSTLCWSGAAAQYCVQGQGRLTGRSGTRE